MIRNIVFDMGMVLLEYDPVKVCWEYTDNPEDVEWMRRELFESKEWSLLDEGTLTDAQALERVQKRLPNEHLRWLAKESLEHWHEYNIWAKPGMGELVKELKEKASDDNRILFTGFVQGRVLEELYSNAYLYILPSNLEGMPLSLLEAMSYGNCCVVSDIAECTEVVEDKAAVFPSSAMNLKR